MKLSYIASVPHQLLRLFALQKMRLMKASHDQLLNELELSNRNLQVEQSKSTSLHSQLKQGTSSNIVLAEVCQYLIYSLRYVKM